jgi:hypothetical protein
MIGTFHSIWKFEVSDLVNWNTNAKAALVILQTQQGFIRANIIHSADESQIYVVQTDWSDVGSYRRALGSMEAKIGVWPFLAEMKDEPTAFEKLLEMTSGELIEFETSVTDGS